MPNRSTLPLAAFCARSVVALAAASFMPLLPASAWAQAGGMAGIGQSDTVAIRARVQSVNAATRAITLLGPAGKTLTVVAGPQVINFDKIKVGDSVTVQYQDSVAYVLSPPNAKLPDASLTEGGVGAAAGQMPAGAVGARLVITGLVAGLDASNHTLQIVDPSGGEIRTVHVTSPEGLKNFNLVKVGDTITAVMSQTVAAAVTPAS